MTIRKRYADVAGVRVHYLEAGNGAPLLLLPSPLVRARSYRPPIARLSERFRVLAVELPGSGRSSRLPRPWSFREYARWTTLFLDTVGVERAVMACHSNAGPVGLLLATLYPERVEKLVLVDSIGASTSDSLLPVLLGRILDGFLELQLSARAWPDLAWNPLFHARTFAHQVRQSARTDLLPAARTVTVSTLVAWGGRDHTTPPACASRFAAAVQSAALHVSETGSHDWCITHAEEFAAAVERFVDS